SREKTGEPSWGASDNGATTASWHLCKVTYDSSGTAKRHAHARDETKR
ncbi:unnamed protein product, partial [Ascophyllum nodosum]